MTYIRFCAIVTTGCLLCYMTVFAMWNYATGHWVLDRPALMQMLDDVAE